MPAIRIEGFELIEKLGEGGSAPVWKARQISLDRVVAIKLLPARMAQDSSTIERFKAEAHSAAKLKHPGIVQVYDASVQDGVYYIVMEYVAGYTVGDWLRRKGALQEKDALLVAECVAEALGHAWEKEQIVHCDIKPDNVFIDADGAVKVGDLGLARIGATGGREWAEEVMGTPAYISPEQALGKSVLDFRSDIYSLGASLYHLVCGRHLFQGKSDEEMMELHVRGTDEDPMDVNPRVSAPMAALIERMLAKRAEDRHDSWAEVREDIARVRRGRMPAGPLVRGAKSSIARSRRRRMPATTRTMVARRLAEKTRGEPRPAAVWLILAGAAVLVSIFSLAHSCAPAVPKRKHPAPAVRFSPSGPAHRPEEPDPVMEAARAEWEKTAAWLAANPDSYDESMRRLSVAAAKTAGTRYSLDVEDAVGRLKRGRAEQVEGVMKRLSGDVASLAVAGRWEDAAAVYESYSGPLAAETLARRGAIARELRGRPPAKVKAGNREDDSALWSEFLASVVGALKDKGASAAVEAAGPFMSDQRLERRAGQVSAVCDLLTKAATIDTRILKSFEEQAGQTVVVGMASGASRQLRIDKVIGSTVWATQLLSRDGATAGVGVSFKVSDLSVREQLSRMGADDQPEVALVKGLMALSSSAYPHARRFFGAVPAPLGPMLVEMVDSAERRAAPSPPAADPAPPHGGEAPAPAAEPAKLLSEAEMQDIRARLVKSMTDANPAVMPEEIDMAQDASGGISVVVVSPGLSSLSPVSGINNLRSLSCGATHPGNHGSKAPPCQLSDLAPLRGLPLSVLHLTLASVRDLAPLQGLRLRELSLNMNPVSDLGPLSGMPLESLSIRGTKVRTLVPVRDSPLKALDINGSLVADLGPVNGMRLERVDAGATSVQNISPLRNPELKALNLSGTRVHDFMPLKNLDLQSLDVSDTQFRDTQVLKDTALRSLRAARSNVSDLRGLAGMPLERIFLDGTLVSDLSPLAGAPLVAVSLAGTRVIDISPIGAAPLRDLNLSNTRVRDLRPIEECRTLKNLNLDFSEVRNAEPIRLLRLESLQMRGVKVIDYSFLRGLPIEHLWIDTPEQGIRETLLTMPKLRSVNGQAWVRQ